jgi:hypothetical protein
MSGRRRVLLWLVGGAVALSLGACGGDGGGTPPTLSTPPPTPSAAVTASGNGAIVIHPSAAPAWFFALEMPVRLQETGGGTADWNYARLALFQGGAETERAEIGSDLIIQGGAGRLNPNSNAAHTLVFRINSDEFDDIQLEFGFSDVNHGSQFTRIIDLDTFTDVTVSLVPLSVPQQGRIEIGGQ